MLRFLKIPILANKRIYTYTDFKHIYQNTVLFPSDPQILQTIPSRSTKIIGKKIISRPFQSTSLTFEQTPRISTVGYISAKDYSDNTVEF